MCAQVRYRVFGKARLPVLRQTTAAGSGEPQSGRRVVGQPAQGHAYGIVEIAIGEAGAAQLQPRRDALEEYAALLHRQGVSGGHDGRKLIVAE